MITFKVIYLRFINFFIYLIYFYFKYLYNLEFNFIGHLHFQNQGQVFLSLSRLQHQSRSRVLDPKYRNCISF